MTSKLLPSEHMYLDDQFTSQRQRENQPKYEPKVTVEEAKAATETLRQWALEQIIQRKPFRYVLRGILYSARFDETKGVGWWEIRHDRFERDVREEFLIGDVQASDAFLEYGAMGTDHDADRIG